MTVKVSSDLLEELRRLAAEQGRDLESLVEEAVRDYLDAAAITDVGPGETGETQMKLAPELPGSPTYVDRHRRADDATG